MKKYFKDEKEIKICLLEYFTKIEQEYKQIDEQLKEVRVMYEKGMSTYSLVFELEKQYKKQALKYARIRLIYKALGDVRISESMIDTICESFDETKCRYGTTCFKLDSITALYKISEMFPRLSKEALLSISREYITDLFDSYRLIIVLFSLLKREGYEDETFEKFMSIVKEFADKQDKIYEIEAFLIGKKYKFYSSDFIEYFKKFAKQHHITYDKFSKSVPEADLILKDELQLKGILRKARECWGACYPISYQMLEAYLDGDTELSLFSEQPLYDVRVLQQKIPTTFTKTELLDSIEKQKESKIKIRK